MFVWALKCRSSMFPKDFIWCNISATYRTEDMNLISQYAWKKQHFLTFKDLKGYSVSLSRVGLGCKDNKMGLR